MSASGIRALVFDVFGTVVDWHGGISLETAAFLERQARKGVDAATFANAWRAKYQPALEQVRSGARPFVTLDVLHRENLDATLGEFGLDETQFAESELAHLNLAWHRLPPWPDAVTGIARLRERYIAATLSNGNVALMIDLARHARLSWDAILGAEVVRAYKPSPEAYLRCVAMLALAPAQVCMVAAHPSDLAAASRCGLRTAFVARPMESGSLRAAVPGGRWDFEAQDINDLADQLLVEGEKTS